jgi:hypothetical protein
MPGSRRATFTNPTSVWGAASILNNDGGQALRVSFDLPWYRTVDYADLNALVAAAGAGPYAVIVNADKAVTANLTLGVGIHLVYEPGCEVTVNNGVTLTIASPEHVHCPVRQQAFVRAGTGVAAFAAGGTVYPAWWGAVADGAADDTAAIAAALACLPAYGRLHFPAGAYRITAALTKVAPVVITGEGDKTLLSPDMGALADMLTLGTAAYGQYYGEIRDLAVINNTANSCKDVFVLQRLYDCRVDRVTVCTGHAAYALNLKGATGAIVDKFCTGYTNAAGAYQRGAGGIYVGDLVDQSNNVALRDLFINIHTGDGVHVESALSASGLEVSGIIQNCDGYGIYLKGLVSVWLHDLYPEVAGDIHIEDVDDLHYGPACYGGYAGDLCELVDCSRVVIDGARFQDLTVDAACIGVDVRSVQIFGSLTVDPDARAIQYTGPVRKGSQTYLHQGDDYENLWHNAAFTRWRTDRPDGWDKVAAVTWTQCGDGLGDATKHAMPYSAKLAMTSWDKTRLTMPLIADVLGRLKGQSLSLSYWVRTSGAPAAWPTMEINVTGPSAYAIWTAAPTVADTWTQIRLVVDIPADATGIYFDLWLNGTAYLAEFTLTGGLHPPRGFVQPAGEVPALQIAGRRLEYAAAMPAAGYYLAGDIVFNTAPAKDGNNMTLLGWSRLVTGAAHVDGTDWAKMYVSHVSPAT